MLTKKGFRESDNKDELILQFRRDLIKLGDELNIVRQQFVTANINDIKKYILSNRYFEPTLFIRLMESVFDCNIFLYNVDSTSNQKGDVLLPSYKEGYFMEKINVTKRSVVILCHKTILGYHCEIIVRDKTEYFISEDAVKRNADILSRYDQILISDVKTKIIPYETSKFLKLAKSQGIDEYGKVYLLNYEKFSLFTSPIAPLPLPINNKITKISYDEFKKIKGFDYKELGTTSDGKGLVIGTKSFTESYVPLSASVVEKFSSGESFGLSIFSDPPTVKSSELNKMRKNQKIANMLKEYVLFFYSLRDCKIRKKDFEIIEDHKYKITDKLYADNSNIFSSNKMIVKSEAMRDRLIYYIDVSKLNIPNLKDYKDNKVIRKQYVSTSDFKERIHQKIVVNKLELHQFLIDRDEKLDSIVDTIYTSMRYGYFFSNSGFAGGEMCIIQNVVNGDMDRALAISSIWVSERINLGYYIAKPRNLPKKYYVFDLNNEDTLNIKISKDTTYIYKYTFKTELFSKDIYGAVLFL